MEAIFVRWHRCIFHRAMQFFIRCKPMSITIISDSLFCVFWHQSSDFFDSLTVDLQHFERIYVYSIILETVSHRRMFSLLATRLVLFMSSLSGWIALRELLRQARNLVRVPADAPSQPLLKSSVPLRLVTNLPNPLDMLHFSYRSHGLVFVYFKVGTS